MKNLNNKTKKQLIDEIKSLQKQINELEKEKDKAKKPEDVLQESEEILSALFNAVKDSIFIKDLSLRYVKVNPAMEELFGMDSEKLLGKTDMDLFGEEAGRHVIEVDEKVLGGEVVEEFPEKPIDGALHIFHTIKVPLKDSNGKIVGLCGIARNITELKNAEKALRESEARWKTLSENSPALIILQGRDGKVLFINHPVSDQSRKKVVGKSIYNFIPPGFHEIASDCFKKVWKTGKQCSYSTQLKTAEDRIRHFDVWVNPVFEKEEVVAIVSSSFDVSEKKLMEKVLQESEERLSLAIEGARLGLWDYNFRTGEISRNEYWAEMLGYTLREIENNIRGFNKLIHPDDRAKTEEKMQEHEEGKSPDIDVEHRMLNKEGQWKWIRNWGRIVDRDNNGKPLRALGMHFDITARKQAEEELKKYRDHLEDLVKERMAELEEKNKELERFNKLFVKREFRIKELRDRVKELGGKAGEKR